MSAERATNAPGPRRGKIAVIGALVVVGLSLPIGAFLLVQPGTADAPPAAPAPPLPAPETIQQACAATADDARKECIVDELLPLLSSNGIRATFGLLEALTRIDAWVHAQEHPIAHELGRDAYAVVRDAPAAFAECPYTMASGCLHGVLEAYLTSQADISTAQVRPLCDRVAESQGTFGRFQCLHGLGHGLTMYKMHDLFGALSMCDWLATDWEHQSCYGGAFMENIVSYQTQIGMGNGEAGAMMMNHGMMMNHAGVLRPEDPYYPCSVANTSYKAACYNLQSTAILTLNGYDVPAAFTTCQAAEADYVSVCFFSMGRDISSIALREPNRTAELCGQAVAEYRSFCVAGAAKDFVNTAADSKPGLELCRVVALSEKSACYRAVGELVAALYGDEARRRDACRDAEVGFDADCRAGAQV